MELLSGLVALAAVAVAALSLWLGHRERNQPARTALHQRMVDFAVEMFPVLSSTYRTARGLLSEHGWPISQSVRPTVEQDLTLAADEFSKFAFQADALFPSTTVDALDRYLVALGLVPATEVPATVTTVSHWGSGQEAIRDLEFAYWRVLNSVRRSLGIEELNQELSQRWAAFGHRATRP